MIRTQKQAGLDRSDGALVEFETRYRRLFETVQDGILILDADSGEVTDVNPLLVRMLGYSHGEFLGKKVWELGPAKNGARTRTAFQELQHKEYLRYDDLTLETKAGQRIDVEFVCVVYTVGHKRVIQCSIRDITERKRTEAALKAKVEDLSRLATVVSDSNDAIIMHDLAGKILAWNRGANEMYGYTEAEALGQNVRDMVAEADRDAALTLIQRIAQGEVVKSFELRRITRDGRVLDVWLTTTLLTDEAGKPVAIATTERDITELRRSEAALKAKVEDLSRLATVVSDSNDAIIMHDLDGKILAWNHGANEMYGYTEAEALGQNVRDMVAEADREAALTLIQRIAQGEVVKSFELRRVTKDGRVLDVWLTTTLLTDEAGQPVAIATTERDITARKKAEDELHEARDYFENLLNCANAPIIVWNSELRITQFNKAFERLSGRKAAEVLGEEVDILFPLLTREQSHDYFKTASSGDRWEVVEIEIQRVDGSIHTLLWNSAAIYTPDGKTIVAVIAQGQDITRRKKAEIALNEKLEELRRLATVVTDSNDAIILHDLDGKILAWNHGANEIYGYSEGEALGKNVRDIVAEADRDAALDLIQRIAQGEVVESFELRRVTKDGRVLDVWLTTTLLTDEAGKPVAIATTERDITERKRADEERVARKTAERANIAKSEFLSRMSHELRTPLNSILGFTQLLEMDELNPDQMGSLAQILKSGYHLLNLINEVLDISRIEAGKMPISVEPVKLDEALKSAVELIRPLADKHGISIQITIPSSRDVFVTADRQRLKQVLLNLLSNAVKYNRENGAIHVTASLQIDGTLHLVVRDTGGGIPPEKMNRLFVAFDRLDLDSDKVEGTGLGLALSKGLVEAMGGRIGAQSVIGEGSTFWVDLQLTTQEREEIVMAEVDDYLKTSPSPRKGLVLYVEDNLSNIQLIEKVLARLPGVELISAMQGRLALDLARLHKPNLILLDLHLPDLNGEIVLQRLRAESETKNIPVVIMSADATHGQIEHMQAVGADAYLTKPIDVKAFLKMIGEMLRVENPK